MHNSSPLPYYGQIKNTFYQLLAFIQSQSYVSRYYVQYVSGLDQAPGQAGKIWWNLHGLIETMFNDFVKKALSQILFTKDISIKRNVTEMLFSL